MIVDDRQVLADPGFLDPGVIDPGTSLAVDSGIHGAHNDGPEPWLGARTVVSLAMEILADRGFTCIGEDPVGLPLYRSPTGALLIGVGSCRSLAYTKVDGRLQVVAAARTATLICRIEYSGVAGPLSARTKPAATPPH
jgi:hypothetical protein